MRRGIRPTLPHPAAHERDRADRERVEDREEEERELERRADGRDRDPAQVTDERDDHGLAARADELLDDAGPRELERGAARAEQRELRCSGQWLRFVDAFDRLRFGHATVTP